MAAGRPEAGQDVALRQRGEVAEAGQAHAGEQADQLGVDLADDVQPGHRQRGEERRRRRRAATTIGARPARRAATAEAKRPSAIPTPTPVADGCRPRAHGGDELLGERLVATEVARRAAGAEAQPARLDDLQARGEPADARTTGSNARASRSGSWSSSATSGQQLLGLAAALADGHALGRGRRRAGDDPVGVQHDRRHAGRRPRPRRPASRGTTP